MNRSAESQQLEDLRAACDLLPSALVQIGRDGCIEWLNRAAESLLELDRNADYGLSLEQRLGASELGNWLRRGAETSLQDLAAPANNEVRLQVDLLALSDGKRLLLARDTSQLSRLQQTRSDFVANVSHELRTPLTVIHGYLEMLDPDEVPSLAPVLREMQVQSRRMGQVVEDLLTLTRLETQQELENERVDMGSLLESLEREAVALSKGRHTVTVQRELAADLLGSVKDLHGAFSNLVSNAVRYTPDKGRIEISWRPAEDGGEFSVKDTGYGIPAEHIGRLAERFYRVSTSRSRELGGTGLGLSIVKHVLNLHQARMRIESTPGEGSIFRCSFDSTRLLKIGEDPPQS